MKRRLSSTSVVATLALFLAIGGTTAVGANALLTGKAVKDESLTGSDIQNNSLTGADIRTGSLGSNVVQRRSAREPEGRDRRRRRAGRDRPGRSGRARGCARAGRRRWRRRPRPTSPATSTWIRSRPPICRALRDYVVFARITATNTGGSHDNLNCALFIGDPGRRRRRRRSGSGRDRRRQRRRGHLGDRVAGRRAQVHGQRRDDVRHRRRGDPHPRPGVGTAVERVCLRRAPHSALPAGVLDGRMTGSGVRDTIPAIVGDRTHSARAGSS